MAHNTKRQPIYYNNVKLGTPRLLDNMLRHSYVYYDYYELKKKKGEIFTLTLFRIEFPSCKLAPCIANMPFIG